MSAQQRAGQHGSVLAMVIIGAVIFSIAAYAMLNLSLSRTQSVRYNIDRYRARYAAEAGMVYAMQKLWANPNWSSGQGWTKSEDLDLDTNADGIADTQVDIIIPKCTKSPCEMRRLQAQVVY